MVGEQAERHNVCFKRPISQEEAAYLADLCFAKKKMVLISFCQTETQFPGVNVIQVNPFPYTGTRAQAALDPAVGGAKKGGL